MMPGDETSPGSSVPKRKEVIVLSAVMPQPVNEITNYKMRTVGTMRPDITPSDAVTNTTAALLPDAVTTSDAVIG
jgi:hypothetical protein